MPQGIDQSKAEAYVRRLAHARLEAAAIYLVGRIKENVGVPSRTVTYQQGRSGKFRKVLGARGSDRSKPGDFPHKDFGNFRASVTWNMRDEGASVIARVGSPSKVGLWLEFGTRRMAARGWLRRTLKEEQEPIRQIAEHGEQYSITVTD